MNDSSLSASQQQLDAELARAPGFQPRSADVAEPSVTDARGAAKKAHLSLSAKVLLAMSLATGALTHGYNMFNYPLYLTDEGIYMQQAWSIIRELRMSPYTYFYDHAPGGWIMIAGWVAMLPNQFATFGNAINTGRVLMLLVHLGSVFLLFEVTRRLSGSLLAAFVATMLFNTSPLAVYYQRQVLIDNMMVFWMLLSLYLITKEDGRVMTVLLSGLAFGISTVTKENTIFFAPAVGYLVYTRVKRQPNYRFGLGFWAYAALSTISLYFLFATLKNELLPSHFNFNLNNPPADHVSLLYSIWWQLHRSQGSILDIHSYFWFIVQIWLQKDSFLLVAGIVAMFINLFLGIKSRKRYRAEFVAGLLATGYAFYIARGSQMLEFYVVPLLPFLAMNMGLLLARLLGPLRRSGGKLAGNVLQGAVTVMFLGALIAPVGSYILVHDEYGKVVLHDLYKLPVTYLQAEQLAYIRQHIPRSAKIIMDDDLWVDLHDMSPSYRWANSHWKASSDPAIRDNLFHQDWRNIDYIVLSNQMIQAMNRNNGDGRETWILEGLRHAHKIWGKKRGGIEVQIYQIDK